MAKTDIKPGGQVHLVTARGEHIPATVTKVGKGDLIDLEAEYKGEEVVITSSPLDETGKKPDSWHAIEADAK